MRWGRVLGLALLFLLAAVETPRTARADGAEVPRAPLSEAALGILRKAVESAAADVQKARPWEKDLVLTELDALERFAKAPIPDMTRLERVRVVLADKDPIEGRAWRVPGAVSPPTLVLSDFTVVAIDAERVKSIELASYAEELAGLLTPEGKPAPETPRSPWRPIDWALGIEGHRAPRLLPHAIAAAALGDEARAKAIVAAGLASNERVADLYEAAARASFRAGANALRSGESWGDALRAWFDTARSWPGSKAGTLAAEYVSVLEKQVPEMEALAAAPPPAADAPVEARVAWHAARLADERDMRDWATNDVERTREALAHERALVQIGPPALPELVDRMGDRRLTRRFLRDDFHGWQSDSIVLRVQDLALQAIQEITGLRFLVGSPLCDAPLEARARVVEDVERWWAETGTKGRAAQLAARVFVGDLWSRLQALRLLEREAPTAIDARDVLRRWAVEFDAGALPEIAAEAASRGDLSLLPAVRGMESWYGGDHESRLGVLLKFGDTSDVAALREVLRASAGKPDDEFARRRTSAILRGAIASLRPIVAPLLVDVLDLRGPWPDGGSSDPKTPADGAMAVLAKRTGHDEGWKAEATPAERFAAMDRWMAWWRREGRAAYIAAHPEVEAADPRGTLDGAILPLEGLPPLVEVERPLAPIRIVHDVPRAEVRALLESGDVVATRGTGVAGKQWRFAFASSDAAARWFDAARPVPAPAATAASPVVEGLGPRGGDGLVVAPDGVAWIWTSDSGNDRRAWRTQVEAGAAATPRPRFVLVGNMRRLFLDRSGVLWLAPAWDDWPLVGYDLAKRVWIEPALVDETGAPAKSRKDDRSSERTIKGAFATRDGRLLFADSWGVHSREGGVWTYAGLIPPAAPGADRPNPLADAQFVEDKSGRVWLWSRWMSGVGAFRLDRGAWTRVVPADVPVHTLVPSGGDDAWLFGPHGDFRRLHDGKVESGDNASRALHPNLRFRYARVMARTKEGCAYALLDETTVLEPFRKGAWWAVFVPVGGPAVELGHAPTAALRRLVGNEDTASSPDGWIWGRDGTGTLVGADPNSDRQRTIAATRTVPLQRVIGFDAGGSVVAWGSAGLYRVRIDEAAGSDAPLGALLPTTRLTVARAWPDSEGRPRCTHGEHQSSLATVDGASVALADPPADPEGRYPRRIVEARAGADGSMLFVDDGGKLHLIDDAGWTVAPSMAALLEAAGPRIRKALSVPPPRVTRNATFHAAIDDRGVLWFAYGRGAWGAIANGTTISGRDAGIRVGLGSRFIEILEPVGDGRVFVRDEENDAGVLEVRDGRIVSTVPFDTGRYGAGGIPPFDVAMRDRDGRLHVVFGRGAGTVGPAGVVENEVDRRSSWFLAEDRRGGRWWYENRGTRTLVRTAADGKESRLALEQGPEMLAVAEAPDGSMWTWETGALLRVVPSGESLAVVERYPMRMRVSSLWCDAKGRLWVYGEDEHGITRQLTGFATTPSAPSPPK